MKNDFDLAKLKIYLQSAKQITAFLQDNILFFTLRISDRWFARGDISSSGGESWGHGDRFLGSYDETQWNLSL